MHAPDALSLAVETMGPDDERVRAWDDLVRRNAPGPT